MYLEYDNEYRKEEKVTVSQDIFEKNVLERGYMGRIQVVSCSHTNKECSHMEEAKQAGQYNTPREYIALYMCFEMNQFKKKSTLRNIFKRNFFSTNFFLTVKTSLNLKIAFFRFKISS